jgi:hypothetical protein
MFRKTFLAALVGATALAGAAAVTAPATAQPSSVQVGTLECSMSAGIGMLIGSQRNVSCNFRPNNGPPEAYMGTMTIIGLDVGVTSGGAMIWGVFTNTNRYSGMLTGTYAGGSAQATVGAGVGANALIGGSNNSVALQPLSVQSQVGLNFAAGVGSLELHFAQ